MEGSHTKNFNGKIGSYAISTVDFSSWTNNAVNSANPKTKKTRGTKEVVNKIFADYVEILDDSFWKEKFKNASIGKFPTKFSYKEGSLCFKKGQKVHTLQVPKNISEGANACMDFFRTHGGFFSPDDIRKSAEEQKRHNEEIVVQELTWANANKKCQECLISYYVLTTKENMKLTNSEMEQLRETINLGVVDKFFGKHNIIVKNKRIHIIEGLLWNSEKRQFYIGPDVKQMPVRGYTRKKHGPPAVDPSLKDTISNFGTNWCKYLDLLDKKWDKEKKHERNLIMKQNIDDGITTSPHVDNTTNSYTDTTDNEDDDD